jgi:hypothetical protein
MFIHSFLTNYCMSFTECEREFFTARRELQRNASNVSVVKKKDTAVFFGRSAKPHSIGKCVDYPDSKEKIGS